jgi:hypothetical protein
MPFVNTSNLGSLFVLFRHAPAVKSLLAESIFYAVVLEYVLANLTNYSSSNSD